MRIFKGDKPAAQFEAGQEKGGNFYCFSCANHAETTSSYVHTHSLAIETIHNRVNQVMKTELSLSKSKQRVSFEFFSNFFLVCACLLFVIPEQFHLFQICLLSYLTFPSLVSI